MTIMLHKSHAAASAPWSSVPGWGIVADLTPPELQERRTLAVLRRIIAAVLVLVLLLCVAGYVFASRSVQSADRALDMTTSQTPTIQREVDKHSGVTRLRSVTAAIDSQLATLYSTDVDVSKLVRDLILALPGGMEITSVNVTMSAAGDSSGAPTAGGAGTVTLTGTSRDLNDLAHYVTALNRLNGVTAVLPTTNASSSGTASWTLSLQLTAARYTNRFGSLAPATTTDVPPSDTPTADGTGGN